MSRFRWIFSFVLGLGLLLGLADSALAQLVIPPTIAPEGLANSALTIIAPLVVIVVTLSLTLWAAMVVVRLLRRRSQQIQ